MLVIPHFLPSLVYLDLSWLDQRSCEWYTRHYQLFTCRGILFKIEIVQAKQLLDILEDTQSTERTHSPIRLHNLPRRPTLIASDCDVWD